jgi:uncharacterized phage protein gp47/JayE
MPWSTPTLKTVRSLVRDAIRGNLPGADATIPNSVLRVMSDAMGALCHLTLQYIDWLALQLIPDTAETEWLDRHGDIWLVNADGTTGRKLATLSEGTAGFISDVGGRVVPVGARLGSQGNAISYEVMQEVFCAPNNVPTPGPIRAIDPGSGGNLDPGTSLTVIDVPGVNEALVIQLDGGTEQETDDDLRVRVLQRIRQPPMGGADHDYIRWALAVPGVTRAWVKPLEMGIGTVTVRVLFDVLRADDDGWPRQEDLDSVSAYLDTVRPVAVKDFWVLAPIKQFIDVHIRKLSPDNPETRDEIETSLLEMLTELASPGQTIFAVWKAQAIMNSPNVVSFDMDDWDDDVMQSPGHMAVLGDIVYDGIGLSP